MKFCFFLKAFSIFLVAQALFLIQGHAHDAMGVQERAVQLKDYNRQLDGDTVPRSELHNGEPFYGFFPYVPREREYVLELGSMWEAQTMYWVGGKVGFHMGRCLWSQSQTCQQFVDLLGGVGGRDGYTNGFLMAGPRWQFISFPEPYSPSFGLLVGVMNLSDKDRDKQALSYGVSYGWTVAVHQNLDLRFDIRAGGGDQVWGQAYMGIGLKIDNLVSYFAKKIKAVGEGTITTTGKVIKGTAETIKKAVTSDGGSKD